LARKISSINCGLQTFGDILHVNIIYTLVHEHTITVLTGNIKSRCGGERELADNCERGREGSCGEREWERRRKVDKGKENDL